MCVYVCQKKVIKYLGSYQTHSCKFKVYKILIFTCVQILLESTKYRQLFSLKLEARCVLFQENVC